jgi:hypothetical protein
VHQSRELKIHIFANTLAIKTGKQRRGCSSVKTFAVVKNPDSHSALFPFFHTAAKRSYKKCHQWQILSSKAAHLGAAGAYSACIDHL